MNFLFSVVVLALVAGTCYLSAQALLTIISMIRSGKDLDLSNRKSDRISSVITYVFGQKKVLEDPTYGFMHFFYLYGFLILGVGHLEVVLHGLTKFVENFGFQPFLYRNFLPYPIIQAYELSQDFMAASVVAVVSVALYKRLSGSTKRLKRSADAERILWLIGALYVSFFILGASESSLRMHAGEITQRWHWQQPVSSLLALGSFGLSENVMHGLHGLGYWSHLLIFLGFAVYIPRSKHMHLLAAGPNIYFRRFDEFGKPRNIDFTTATKFGVSKVDELSWKSLLDTFACTECGRCDAVCPANLTGKALKPQKVLKDIKLNLRYKNWDEIQSTPKNDEVFEHKTPLFARQPLSEIKESSAQIHLDEIWACTTCGACAQVCPVLIDSVPGNLIEMRRHFVLMEAQDYPKEINSAMRGMEMQGNPWGIGKDKRIDWANSLDVPLMSDNKDREVEYLFWVGCAGATDDRAKKIQQALVRILKKANVDFAILGCEEKCTGDPARRMGNEYIFDTLAQENIATLNKYKFKKIFATCPHCYNSLANEYKELGVQFSVQHHTELLAELMKDKRIPLDSKKEIQQTITFHDPCYLGRYNKKFEEPRNALSELKGVALKEMSFAKEKSFCCGAGGGRMFMEEHAGKRVNHERTEQAQATGASVIATGCPFCMTMLNDGVADKGLTETMIVKDVAEIIAERIEA